MKEDDYLLCMKDPMVITKVTDANKLWLQGETYLLCTFLLLIAHLLQSQSLFINNNI